MATLRIDKDTFTNEREVVKEERRMRVDNQPYGRLNEIIYDQAFTVHPYKHATIGSMADLEAASVEDVRDFYKTYYVPSNATLVLVGDFEPAQALHTGQPATSAACRRRERDVPRDIPKEPPQTKEKRVTLQEPWPLPAVVVAHHVTYDGNPDSYPLHIAAKVLSDGQSSRIYKKLVYEKQMAVAAFGSANLIEDPNLFYAVAIVQPGHTTDEVAERARSPSSRRLKTEPITAHELQRTKNQFARDYILGRESNQQKAGVLAHAVVIHNDIKTADGEFDIFQNITVADVQRVARRPISQPENRLVLTLMPSGKRADEQYEISVSSCLHVLHSLYSCILLCAAASAQVRNWPTEAPAAAAAGARHQVPALRAADAAQRAAGRRGHASRAAGR